MSVVAPSPPTLSDLPPRPTSEIDDPTELVLALEEALPAEDQPAVFERLTSLQESSSHLDTHPASFVVAARQELHRQLSSGEGASAGGYFEEEKEEEIDPSDFVLQSALQHESEEPLTCVQICVQKPWLVAFWLSLFFCIFYAVGRRIWKDRFVYLED